MDVAPRLFHSHHNAWLKKQMQIEEILSKLDKVKQYNQRSNSWVACCPSHNDKTPSLAVKMLADGRVLLHCFGGCGVEEIVESLGLRMADLMGDAPTEYHHQVKRANRIPLMDMLRAMQFDSMRVGLYAARMAQGEALTEEDKNALLEMSGSFQMAVDYISGVRH